MTSRWCLFPSPSHFLRPSLPLELDVLCGRPLSLSKYRPLFKISRTHFCIRSPFLFDHSSSTFHHSVAFTSLYSSQSIYPRIHLPEMFPFFHLLPYFFSFCVKWRRRELEFLQLDSEAISFFNRHGSCEDPSYKSSSRLNHCGVADPGTLCDPGDLQGWMFHQDFIGNVRNRC